MSRVFFTSDLHFGHNNLTMYLRGMSSDVSDYIITKNWNNTISKRDTVYVLGDITMEKPTDIQKYISNLNGNICIIGGNHDTKRCCKEYMKLGIPVMGALEYKGFICTHIPIHESEVVNYRGNIHGHIHLHKTADGHDVYKPEELGKKYYNVNIELHSYFPVPFEEIEKEFIKRAES